MRALRMLLEHTLRNGEAKHTWFRSDRFFCVDGEYYFATREKIDVGPFPDHQAAERGLALYIQYMTREGACPNYASKLALEGKWALVNYH